MKSNPLEKRLNIEVSLARPRSPKEQLPRVVVIGIVPYDAPIISQVSPAASIRSSFWREGHPYVEQVRLSSPAQSSLLPGIELKYPSRLRDAVGGILGSGVPEVDCLLARIPGLKPWDFSEQEVMEMLVPFFNEVPGAMIVFPDAGGPWPRSWQAIHDNPEQRRNLLNTIKAYGPLFAEHFQLGFFDAISLPEDEAFHMFNSLVGYDISLCCWSGTEVQLQSHGWRSAAATMAGYVSKRTDIITQSFVGHKISLVGGRKIVRNRAHLLQDVPDKVLSSHYEDFCIVLDLDDRGEAQILSEYTMRRPRFEWNIPVVRTVKAIHQSMKRAADMFVFREVKKVEAVALEKTMEMVLMPFYERGILVGSNGEGAPSVRGDALPSHSKPMLSVDLSAMVRPWCQNISLKVMVKSGEESVIEEV